MGEDPELFFPPKGQTSLGIKAQMICLKCTVRAECDDYRQATHSTDGIWAGKFTQRGKKE